MNQAPGQQAAAQGQPGAANQQRQTPMYQPEQIRNLPTLSDDEKQKYEAGLRGLWVRVNDENSDTAQRNAARDKIVDFSKMLFNKIQQRRMMHKQQEAQGQAGQPAQGGQPGQAPQGQAQPQSQPMARPPPAQQNTPVPIPQPGQQQAQAANGAAAARRMPDNIVAHVRGFNFRAPPGNPEPAKWIEETKNKYARALMTMESTKGKVNSIDKFVADRNANKNPLNDDENARVASQKESHMTNYKESKAFVENFRRDQQMYQQQANAQQQAPDGVPNGAPAAAPTPAPNAQANRPAPANGAQNQPQQAGRGAPAQGAAAQQKPAPPPAQRQAQAKPTPVNTTAAAVAAASQAPSAGTPTQARVQTPQSAAPPGPMRALSHSMAMSLANQRAVNTPGGTQSAGPQQSGLGTPTGVNQGGSGAGTPQQPQTTPQQPQQLQQPQLPMGQPGHTHAHPSQQQTGGFQSKTPIPKQLPEKAMAIPQGVAVGGGVNTGRPTMSQGSGTLGGVMNAPALSRVPAYSHEAEGDHVLSKKKLDELVRQTYGGSGEGQENLLSPEVEEGVLNMADSFVDNVLQQACRNAKERGSKVLEIRDLQLVLERTYNIRVPGYSSDELRTVRKVQPAAGWIAKMSAVQAAKVMPGKGE